MKKPLKIFLISLGVLFVIYVVFSQTNMFTMYKSPSAANEPGIEANSIFFISNLIDHDNGDFVCYEYEDELVGKGRRVHRLVGKSKDVVEIKDGVLYLNDQNFDQNIEVKHFYLVDNGTYRTLLHKNLIDYGGMSSGNTGQWMVELTKAIAEKYDVSDQLQLESKDEVNEVIQKKYNENWNRDHFGPIRIPQGKCFVIGDNRHNSMDSRIIGLIDEADIFGTALWK